MVLFALRRLLLTIPLLIGITFVSLLVIHRAPGEPVPGGSEEMGHQLPREVIEKIREVYGLDKPLHVQYWNWLKRVVRLDFGKSFQPDGRPVLTKIRERLPITLFLNVVELIIIVFLAVPIGVRSATRQYSTFDKVTTLFVFVGFATPDFWLALLLMILFGVQLGWLHAEEDHEQQREPEVRCREADEHEQRGDLVEGRILAGGRPHADGHRQ